MINFRQLHRKIAPILFLPLLLTALTGVGYRLGRAWFNLPHEIGDVLLGVHQGSFVGKPLVPIYVLWMGLGLLGLVVTGIVMIKQRWGKPQSKQGHRWLHRGVGAIACLPLLMSAITGISFRLGKTWFGLSDAQGSFLMALHEGRYLGNALRPFYVLMVGLGLGVLLFTGIQMTGIFRPKKPPEAHKN
ncbi:PepSY domain-containing protein [Spirulina sp. CCNP1310]|uniref:PepSY domain-containing protein n=1 Tax=Spirulina sp. CCNP1310 TaxID=3110249 RepID=UPI002B1F4B3E|nr:PepSY domain-containing protein [Spirulina sp. CCNP1310]MEA5419467.1 PepSY domain-containing protein [Spirulina sp. CCNP1310]